MIIYRYNPETKEYTYSQLAQKNPKRPNEFLFPANCTEEQLPLYDTETETVLFIDGHWAVTPDYRGQEVLNLETLEFEKVDYIGAIKEGYQILTDTIKDDFLANPECYKVKNGELVSIKGTQELADKFEEKFNQEFITTNLGCVRISTKWGNFLTIKPNYDMQVQALGYLPAGVLILYKKPTFTDFDTNEEVENWLLEKGQYKNERVELADYTEFSQQVLNKFASEVG
jgi:hypothetical protein